MKKENNLEGTEEIVSAKDIQETQTEIIQTTDEISILSEIHNDLGFICCFLVFFSLVILLKYSYKYFNMIFNF